MTTFNSSRTLGRSAPLLLIALVTLVTYSSAITFPFFSVDDSTYVTSNAMVRQGLTQESWRWAWTTLFFGNWAPLTWLSLMVDATIYGANPSGYHLTNILLHATTAAMFFLVLRCLVKQTGIALLSALVFALHPLAVEPTCWIASRKDLLSGMLWMVTLLAYLSYSRQKNWMRYVLVLLALGLGLSAKSSLICIPFLFLLLDYWPLKRIASARDLLRMIREKVPLCVLCGAYIVITTHAQSLLGATSLYPPLPLTQRLLEVGFYYGVHLQHFFLPTTTVFPYPQHTIPLSQALLWMALIGAATTAATLMLKRAPWLFVGWSWWLLGLLPFVHLIPVGYEPVADRWNYIPACGLIILSLCTLVSLAKHFTVPNKISTPCAVSLLLLLQFISLGRIKLWSNPTLIFEDSLARYPTQYNAHSYLASHYRSQGLLPEAVAEFKSAVEANPFGVFAFGNLGQVLNSLDRTQELLDFVPTIPAGEEPYSHIAAGRYLHTISSYSTSRKLFQTKFGQDSTDAGLARLAQATKDPRYAGEAEVWIGRLLLIDQRWPAAIEHFLKALQSRPADALLHSNIGACYLLVNQPAKAIEHLVQATTLAPSSADTYLRLAHAQSALELRRDALGAITRALLLDPNLAAAHSLKGTLLLADGYLQEARSALERAAFLNPNSEETFNSLGLVAFKSGDYELAIVSFSKATALAPSSATIYVNLAMALMRAHKKAEAEAALKRALELDPGLYLARKLLGEISSLPG